MSRSSMRRSSAFPPVAGPEHLASVRRQLRAWYRRAARDLPWRARMDDPYAQWLAEMMLHQTQTTTVIPYYHRFLEAFPTVAELAAAPRERILEMWAGLGYYRRAHLLHRAAEEVAIRRGGVFPNTVEGLLELPGVGRYTAGAIASIAFDRRAPIVDGNVRRVFARLFGIEAPTEKPEVQRRMWELALAILPRRGSRSVNQAIMDLGATICAPKRPRCGECPVRSNCYAFQHKATDSLPAPKTRARVTRLEYVVIVVRAGEYVLQKQRAEHGLWAGMWAFPAKELKKSSQSEADVVQALLDELPPAVRGQHIEPASAGEVRHQLTHRAVTFRVFAAEVMRRRLPAGFRWANPREDGLPTAFKKVLQCAFAS
jgi:A/G-specific adenine glycosylase